MGTIQQRTRDILVFDSLEELKSEIRGEFLKVGRKAKTVSYTSGSGVGGAEWTTYTVSEVEAITALDLSGSGSVALDGIVAVPSGSSVSNTSDIVWLDDDWQDIFIEKFGAYHGKSDNYQEIQNAVDTARELSNGQGMTVRGDPSDYYVVSTSIIIHLFFGLTLLDIRPKPTDTFSALDTSRLDGLGLGDQSNYNRKSIYCLTAADGRTGNVNTAARGLNIEYQAYGRLNWEGVTNAKQVYLLASPDCSYVRWKNFFMRGAGGTFLGWALTSGATAGDSRHFHMRWENLTIIDCVSIAENEWSVNKSLGQLTMGGTWIFWDCSITRTDKGYEFNGVYYSAAYSCSVDTLNKGAYAYSGERALGLVLSNVGVESKLSTVNTNEGGGVFKFVNSDVTLTQPFFSCGDPDGVGSGSISDYDDGSGTVVDGLMVLDNSRMIWNGYGSSGVQIDGSSSSFVHYPIYLENASTLHFIRGNRNGDFGATDSVYNPQDSSVVVVEDPDGGTRRLLGPTAITPEDKNIWNTASDETTLDGSSSVDFNTLTSSRLYRVNMGSLSLPDYRSINMPEESSAAGILVVRLAGSGGNSYVNQLWLGNNGRNYVRRSNDSGSSWNDWQLLWNPTVVETTELLDQTDAINTSGKTNGRMVLVSNGTRAYNVPIFATGSGSSDTWTLVDGTVVYTPV